jgi:biopolymer transport protein ExbB/TolQ
LVDAGLPHRLGIDGDAVMPVTPSILMTTATTVAALEVAIAAAVLYAMTRGRVTGPVRR